MLQSAYLRAKIGTDTTENEQHFAEICQKLATTLRARRPAVRAREMSATSIACRHTVAGLLRSCLGRGHSFQLGSSCWVIFDYMYCSYEG